MASEKIIIRSASLNDALAIAELSLQLGYLSTTAQIQTRLKQILHQSDHIVLVAVVSEKIVGWVNVFIAHRVESDSFAEIGGLVVNENFRSSGIGKLFMTEAEKWVKEKRIAKLRVRSNVKRKEAHTFYSYLRYEEEKEQKVFEKTL